MTRNDRNCLLAMLAGCKSTNDQTATEAIVGSYARGTGLLGRSQVYSTRRDVARGAGKHDPLQRRLFRLAQRGLVNIDKGHGRYSLALDTDQVAKHVGVGR